MKNSVFSLCGVDVAPGERKTIDLPISQLYTQTPLNVPVHIVNGKTDGPTLLISAAVHGDEINGVEIVRRLLKFKGLNRLRGTLIAVPIVNILGFIQRIRYLPDRRDLNRCFPGSAKGTMGDRIAYNFCNAILTRCTHAIDLHTGAVYRENYPQIRANMAHPDTAAMAEAFGVPLILHAELREGSLRETADKHGIPVITYEGGEALRFAEVPIAAGVHGVVNVMRALGMISPGRSRKQTIQPTIANSSKWIRAEENGIVRPAVKLGARVNQGDLLGVVSPPLGTNETRILAPFNGIVIGRITMPLVNEGEALFHIARFDQVSEAEKQVEALPNLLMEDRDLYR